MGTRRSVVAIGALLGAAVVVASMLPAWGAPDPDRVVAAQLLVLINADRSEAGLAPLAPSTAAAEVAEAWSQFMSDIDDLAHNDGWFTAETRRRLGAGALGENVATNVDIEDAHRRLMNSPGHRANILDARFTHVGIGAVNGPTGAWWITQDFFQMKEAPAVAPPPPPAPPTSEPPPPPRAPTAPSDARPAPAPQPSEPPAEPAPTVPPAPSPPPPAAIASTGAPEAPPVSIEPRELPASDPAPAPLAAAPIDRPGPRPVVPVAVALLLIAANIQRLRRARRP